MSSGCCEDCCAKAAASPAASPRSPGGVCISAIALSMSFKALSSVFPGAGIVGNGDGREGPLVVDDEGGCVLRRLDDAQKRDLRAVPSRHVDMV